MTDDTTVRTALGELKSDELRAAPSFNAVLERTTAQRVEARTSLAFRLAVAGVVLAVAAATYTAVAAKHRRFIVPPEVVAFGAWRPTTDALMPRNGGALGTVPAMGRSILDLDPLTKGAVR
jgi:hypothetical protein